MPICLINPPHLLPPSKSGFGGVSPPLGLAYVAAVLEENNYQVSVLDALALGWNRTTPFGESRIVLGLPYDEITNYVAKSGAEITGISAPFTMQASSVLETAAAIKKTNPHLTVVVGGADATIRPLEYVNHPAIDIVVVGEGELTTVELMKTLDSGGALEEVQGIVYKRNGIPQMNAPRPHIEDLDSLPLPAWHLLPLTKYYEAANSARSTRLTSTFGKRFLPLITSRGCPFNCVFCSVHLHMGRRFRARNPESVVSEMKVLKEQFGVQLINFEDDNMTLNRARMNKLCDLIIEQGLGMEWYVPNGVRADTLNEDLLWKMKSAGCQRLYIAPESGNQKVVNEIIKKRLDLKKVEQAVESCKKVGIRVDAFFVIGCIGETKENIEESIAFAKKLRKLGVSTVNFSIATPLYGTELYEKAKAMGYLRGEKPENMHSFEPHMETPEFTLAEISELYRKAGRVNPLIPREDIGLAFSIITRQPLRALRLALHRLRGDRTSSTG